MTFNFKKRPISSLSPNKVYSSPEDGLDHKESDFVDVVSVEGQSSFPVLTRAANSTFTKESRSLLTGSLGIVLLYLLCLLLQPSKYLTTLGNSWTLLPVDFLLFTGYSLYKMVVRFHRFSTRQKFVYNGLIVAAQLIMFAVDRYIWEYSSHLRIGAFGLAYYHVLTKYLSSLSSVISKLFIILALTAFDTRIARETLYNSSHSIPSQVDYMARHIISFILVDFCFRSLFDGDHGGFRILRDHQEDYQVADESMRKLFEASLATNAHHLRRKVKTPPLNHSPSKKPTSSLIQTVFKKFVNVFYGGQLVLTEPFEPEKGIAVEHDVLSFYDSNRVHSRFHLTMDNISNEKVVLTWEIPRDILVDIARLKGIGPYVSFDTSSKLLMAGINGEVEIMASEIKVLLNDRVWDNVSFNFLVNQMFVDALLPETAYSISVDFCGFKSVPVSFITLRLPEKSEPVDTEHLERTEIKLEEIAQLEHEIEKTQQEIDFRSTLKINLQYQEHEICLLQKELEAALKRTGDNVNELEKIQREIDATNEDIVASHHEFETSSIEHQATISDLEQQLSDIKEEIITCEKQLTKCNEDSKHLEADQRKIDDSLRREKKRHQALEKQMKEQKKLVEKAQNDWQVQSSILNDDLIRLDKEHKDLSSRIEQEQHK